MAKMTFRMDDELMTWLEEWSEGDEQDHFESRSEVMRAHGRNLANDETYREAIAEFEDYNGTFQEYLEERFSTDETIDKVVETVRKAGEGDYHLAQENVDELSETDRDLGWAMHNVVSMYRH